MFCGVSKAALCRPHILPPYPRRSSPIRLYAAHSSVKMSSQIIEHIVLFKVKPDLDPSKPAAMAANLAALSSLDTVLHITAGPLLRCRSSSLQFTHMLHSRYASKPDLDSYSAHPAHVTVVNDYVKPICDDIMAVDWVGDAHEAAIAPGSAIRVTFLKLKEGSPDKDKDEVLGTIGGIKEKFPAIEQLTFGENISPARAKGFSIASIAVFKSAAELEGLDSESEAVNEQKDRVREKLDGVVVLDYVVPSSSPAASL